MSLPALLLLAAPDDAGIRPLLAALAQEWRVTVCVPKALARYAGAPAALAELRARAREASVVLHLSADGAAALAGLDGLVEVYAPAELALCRPGPEETRDADAWEALWRRERDLARRCRRLVVPDEEIALKARLLYGVGKDRLRLAPAEAVPALVREALAEPSCGAPSPAPGFTLALNDYLVIDRHIGGAVRVRQGLAALEADTVLLSVGIYGAVSFVAPRVLQVSVPKGAGQKTMEADLRALTGNGLEDIVSAMHAPAHGPLLVVAADLARRANVAVFEHCYLAPLLDVIHAAAPGLPVVYDAHNVEARLKRELLAGHPAEDALCGFVAEVERRLVDAAALVLCCSEEDAAVFQPQARRVVMMPHGVPPALAPAQPVGGGAPRVGFLGSTHPPNVAAARFILDELAPRLPGVEFEILGSVCAGLATQLPNVVLRGAVSEAAKDAALDGWTMALNPVEGGSGASLKLADYLAHGLPTVNTVHAARGFVEILAGAGVVVPLAEFPAALAQLLRDRPALAQLQEAARRAARAQSWPSVSREARRAINALAADYSPPEAMALLAVGEEAAEHARLYPAYDLVDALVDGEAPALPVGADRLRERSGQGRQRWMSQVSRRLIDSITERLGEVTLPRLVYGFGQQGNLSGAECTLVLPAGSERLSMKWAVAGTAAMRMYCGGLGGGSMPLLLDTVLNGQSALRLPLPRQAGPLLVRIELESGAVETARLIAAAVTAPVNQPVELDQPVIDERKLDSGIDGEWGARYHAVLGTGVLPVNLPAPAGALPDAVRWKGVAGLLAEAASARRGVAARQALGLEHPFILAMEDATCADADAMPLVRYQAGEAAHQDADGQWRRVTMPIGWLLLSTTPPCRLLVVDGLAQDEAVQLAGLAGVPTRRNG
jgi:glycosyltransferase involved in cell wall biosynthesis